MNSKELYSIREWAPLTDVLDRIPTRINRGLFPANLNITCIDAVEGFFALGSDAGIVFWYNRKSGQIQKLKLESKTRITCVKIVDSVEFTVAAGNSSGQVNVFTIQKEPPPDLNLVAPCTKSKPIERYTIKDLHKSIVNCCEWSKNGMKLYSGDRNGVVVLTEFDYHAHISKSIEILNEAYEIVQLSAHQGYLLVSTLYRSIVCHQNTKSSTNWIVTQIGKKDRKQLVDCGGTFFKSSSSKYNGQKLRLICGRPNLRFWLADSDGNVEKTLLFRDAIAKSPTWQIPILNPIVSTNNKKLIFSPALSASNIPDQSEMQPLEKYRNFHNIYSYAGDDALIVTHDESSLYILNLERLKVEAVAKGFRKIIDFCVLNKEIFVLEGGRSLLRLAPMPEKPNKTAKIIYNPSLPPPVPILGSSICGSFEAPVEYEPEQQIITNALECFELPPIETLDLQIPIELAVESSKAEQNRRLGVFKEISEMDFDDDILYHSVNRRLEVFKESSEDDIVHRRGLLTKNGLKNANKTPERSTTSHKQVGIVEIGHAVIQDNDISSKKVEYTAESTKINTSFCATGEATKFPPMENNSAFSVSLNLKESFDAHLPKCLSPTTLKNIIAEKAKLLAKELDLPEVTLQPITDEELRLSKYLSQPPRQISQLATVYPTENIFKNTSMQTTSLEKIYCLEEQTITDYTEGQPIEDICHTLRATNVSKTNVPLRFINTQPEKKTEINSVLLNGERAGDPICKPRVKETSATVTELRKAEKDEYSAASSSSEWEFLDN